MELADLLVVHKADGENLKMSKKTVAEYKQILHFLQPASPGWITKAMPVSSIEKTGIHEVWDVIRNFIGELTKTSFFEKRRQNQTRDWFHAMISDRLMDEFYGVPERISQVSQLEQEIIQGEITVSQAIGNLFDEDNKS